MTKEKKGDRAIRAAAGRILASHGEDRCFLEIARFAYPLNRRLKAIFMEEIADSIRESMIESGDWEEGNE